MNRLIIIFSVLLFLLWTPSFTQKAEITSGPMLGYCEMREVLIWIQTNKEAEVLIKYRESGKEEFQSTPISKIKQENDHIAKVILGELSPGTTYDYQIWLDKGLVNTGQTQQFTTQKLWQFREDPPSFKFALGSCLFRPEEVYDRPGKPYGGDFHILESINKEKPRFMLWLGDNVYLREADWYSKSGFLHRYRHTRAMEELQPLLASTFNYAIWDDHDYGPNNSDRFYREKNYSKQIFDLYWGNPSSGISDKGGITSFFQWADMDFFLLDNRFFRSPNKRKSGKKTQLGKEQLQWLFDGLSSSSSPFKFVCMGGQFLNDDDKYESYGSFFKEERKKIIEFIYKEKIEGVIFLSGDRHHSELSVLKEVGKPIIYDFTVSPLTSAAYNYPDEKNTLRVKDTYVGIRNYGTVVVDGPRKERNIEFQIHDAVGKLLWSEKIKQAK